MASILTLAGVQPPLASADEAVTISDAGLRACLRSTLHLGGEEALTKSALAGVTRIFCFHAEGTADPIKDLTDLSFLTGLTLVSLQNERLTDLTPLASLTKVTRLTVENSGVTDVAPLAVLQGVTYLNVRGNSLTDVAPLAAMKGLTYLNLGGNPVTDGSPLGALTGLTGLTLSSSHITNLSFLSTLSALEGLQVDDVPADPAPIAGLTSLAYLEIGGNSTWDYAFLAGLPHLSNLVVKDDESTTLRPVGHPAALTSLTVQGKELTDLSSLAGFRSVSSLNIVAPKAASLQPLSGLVNLKHLDIESSAVSDLRPISGLAGLTGLNISRSPVSDLSPVTGLPGLEWLAVSDAALAGPLDLSGLTRLTTLNLLRNTFPTLRITGCKHLGLVNMADNKLTSIYLAHLPALTWLVAGDNALTDLSLSDLPTLSTVRAPGNKLRTPGTWTGVPLLSELDLSGNQLTTVGGLASFPALADVNLSDNRLTSIAPIAGLPLTHLKASGNQLTELPSFTHGAALAEIEVAHNKLTVATRLKGLPALTSADLGNNRLTDVSTLASVGSLGTLVVTGNSIADLSAFAGTSKTVIADAQTIAVPENAPVGTPVPVTLRGPDGKLPDLTPDAGVTVAGDTLTYTTAGRHTVAFSQTVGASVFSGNLTRVAGANAFFTTVKAPTLTGAPSVGTPISLAVKAWTPVVDHFSYQWYVDGKAIPDAIDRLYVPAAKDLGHRLRASVTGVKDGFLTVTTWAPTSAKVAPGTFRTKAPTIVGAIKTGKRLSVVTGVWSPKADACTYRWYRSGHPIARATKATYVLTAADLGKHVSVTVKGYAAGFNARSASSKRTRVVTEGPVTSSEPQIIGLGSADLEVDPGAWGPGKITFRYQWLWDGRPIPHATGKTYVLTAADYGHVLAVAVTGDRSSYTAVTRITRGITIT